MIPRSFTVGLLFNYLDNLTIIEKISGRMVKEGWEQARIEGKK